MDGGSAASAGVSSGGWASSSSSGSGSSSNQVNVNALASKQPDQIVRVIHVQGPSAGVSHGNGHGGHASGGHGSYGGHSGQASSIKIVRVSCNESRMLRQIKNTVNYTNNCFLREKSKSDECFIYAIRLMYVIRETDCQLNWQILLLL